MLFSMVISSPAALQLATSADTSSSAGPTTDPTETSTESEGSSSSASTRACWGRAVARRRGEGLSGDAILQRGLETDVLAAPLGK